MTGQTLYVGEWKAVDGSSINPVLADFAAQMIIERSGVEGRHGNEYGFYSDENNNPLNHYLKPGQRPVGCNVMEYRGTINGVTYVLRNITPRDYGASDMSIREVQEISANGKMELV